MTTLPTIKVRLPREAAATHQGMLSIGEWSDLSRRLSTGTRLQKRSVSSTRPPSNGWK